MPKLFVFLTLMILSGYYQVHSQNNENTKSDQQKAPNQNVTVTSPVRVAVEPDVQSIESEKAYKERQEKRDETNATWNRIGIVINSLLFVLVLIQAYISHRQLNSMDASLDHTRAAFFIAERAYIGLSEIQLITADASQPPVFVRAILSNGGRTPAMDVHCGLTSKVVPSETPHPKLTSKFDTLGESSSFVPADKTEQLEFPLHDTVAGTTPLVEFCSGRRKLYVLLEARYTDIEGKLRTLREYCVYSPQDGKFQSLNAVYKKAETATLN